MKQAPFKFKSFSTKQLKVFTWWLPQTPVHNKQGIIADGAIRSGKTVCMSLSFVIWAMESFNFCNFGMCGKTIGSFRRNVLAVLKLMLRSRGYTTEDHRTDNLLVVKRGDKVNYFYIFGGKDESSQDLIQGITLAGLFCDEIALMPESFVNQATGRCSVEGSKYWFNCNPSHPTHWFKTNWIDSENKDILYLHFDMDDNLSLADEIKKRYKSMYTGVFYSRYILGNWVAAEGIIYPQFANNTSDYALDKVPENIIFGQLGMDFGGNGSGHSIQLTGFTAGLKKIGTLEEYYHDNKKNGILSPTELENDFVEFVRMCQKKYKFTIADCYCDSAEQTLIKGLKTACAREHLAINIHNARKGPIIDRIRLYNALFAQHRYFIMSHCKTTIKAFQDALWDSKKLEDVRLDNGTTNIDTLDAQEYSTEKYQKQLLEVRL